MGPFQRIAERWQERRQERRERWRRCPPRQALQELRQEVDQNDHEDKEENEQEKKKRRAAEEERQKNEGKREFSRDKVGEWHLHSLHCEPSRRVIVWYETAQGKKQRYVLEGNAAEQEELQGEDLSLQRHGPSFRRQGEPSYDTDFVTVGAKGVFTGTELHVQIDGLPERTIVAGKGEPVEHTKEATTEEDRARQIEEVRNALALFENDAALLEKFKNEHGGIDPIPLLQEALRGVELSLELQQELKKLIPSADSHTSP